MKTEMKEEKEVIEIENLHFHIHARSLFVFFLLLTYCTCFTEMVDDLFVV